MVDIRPKGQSARLATLLSDTAGTLLLMLGLPGCMGDQLLGMADGEDTEPVDDDDLSDDDGSGDSDIDGDGDSDSDSDADSDSDSDADADDNRCPDEMAGDYDEWKNGDDSLAPGEVTSIVDSNHEGWLQARCVDCHGQNAPWPPADHNPKMDCWAWSCARGFPGGECHGHGPNTDFQFNHFNDPVCFSCTKAECHDMFDPPLEIRYRENHGFMGAEDPLCNACHKNDWTDWPDGGAR